MGIHERPEQALTATLAEQLHNRHLLVVLDNCEHVVEVCAELVGELSSACPRLCVLATSRVPLVIEGEATFEVAGLPVPEADAVPGGTVAAADAARSLPVLGYCSRDIVLSCDLVATATGSRSADAFIEGRERLSRAMADR
ncbi:hypothetical protein [Haloechinothrix halophila]|uniref:hypothetical protein n=1 Tax=Haloechinothrix halophila TaxID=1069073 RepID=UPI000420A047|nr:hypothetical protein [Haloechinothrix halophila]